MRESKSLIYPLPKANIIQKTHLCLGRQKCVFCWRREWDSNPRVQRTNGFQDFLKNPTLPQNNRKYQTIENAENPDVSRVFGVLSFPKSKTPSGARISASKTISKDFLEKVLDKSAPISPHGKPQFMNLLSP